MRVELSCSVAKVVACALVNLCGIPGRIEAHNLQGSFRLNFCDHMELDSFCGAQGLGFKP
jgi:hypothetical protein